MAAEHAGLTSPEELAGFAAAERPLSGTADDDDDRDDEHAGENEAPVGAVRETTEVPEEFEHDDEDDAGPADDRDAEPTDR